MDLEQSLCKLGTKAREDFQAMTPAMPLADRRKIMMNYFNHKNSCLECQITWHPKKP